MKRFLSILALVMVLALCVVGFASCKNNDTPDEPNNGGDDKVTVSWYQGSKLLKEEEITKGSKVTTWTPEVEGKTFTGWYAEASLAQPFDFEKAIEADTDIFAAF